MTLKSIAVGGVDHTKSVDSEEEKGSEKKKMEE
jgi:hypothetical protein